MTLTEYEELVPSFHRGKPKFMALYDAVMGQAVDMISLVESFLTKMNLAAATGTQLDAIGELVGVDRVLPYVPSTGSRTLGDDDYRMLIRGKIATNVWDGTSESLYTLLNNVYPGFGFSVTDNQNMTLDVSVRMSDSSRADFYLELLNAGLIFPIPAGVSATFSIPATASVTDVLVHSGVYGIGQTTAPTAINPE